MTDKPEMIEWVARLAYLEVGEAEKQLLAQGLASVLAYVDELQKVDTSDVKETMQITGLTGGLADDKINQSVVTKETLLNSAPQSDKGMVRVARVVNK
jgi:aspartyl-tRNA(Asn)/glutamyl-tRNA(Gln) amidotransferase subunit C